ncbi:MAG: hypothetical protein GY762_10415 [Proteobacteria bacterium]|nr:hypothetical protein [Pseudomonadota bacterium]
MQSRISAVLCVFLMALAFGAMSCAARMAAEAPTAITGAHVGGTEKPVVIIYEKSGDPLAETIIHEVYCPCYAMYTDEVI